MQSSSLAGRAGRAGGPCPAVIRPLCGRGRWCGRSAARRLGGGLGRALALPLGPWLALLLGMLPVLLLSWPAAAPAIELCSEEARLLMRSEGIPQSKIDAVCRQAARASAPLTLSVKGARNEQGYCRVTLELSNNSTLYLNALSLTVDQARFPPFQFRDVTPGGIGYASENSRILLSCKELHTVKLTFHWPVSLRVGDRSPTGQQLLHYRPYLLDARLAWSP